MFVFVFARRVGRQAGRQGGEEDDEMAALARRLLRIRGFVIILYERRK